jgi:hypothetical protein
MTAIYYPRTKSLTYWVGDTNAKKYRQAHCSNLTEQGARQFLKEHIIRTEIVQEFEIFNS